MFGGAFGRAIGRIGRQNAALAGGRHINSVVADAMPNHHLELRPGLIQKGPIHGAAANDGRFDK